MKVFESRVLDNDIILGEEGLEIDAFEVVLDLGGHTVHFPFREGSAIHSFHKNLVTVRNGTVSTNGATGVRLEGGSGIKVENVAVRGFEEQGVELVGPMAEVEASGLVLTCKSDCRSTPTSRACFARGWISSDAVLPEGVLTANPPSDTGVCGLRVKGRGSRGTHIHGLKIRDVTCKRVGASWFDEHPVMFNGERIVADGVLAVAHAAYSYNYEHEEERYEYDHNRSKRVVVGFLEEQGCAPHVVQRAVTGATAPVSLQQLRDMVGASHATISLQPVEHEKPPVCAISVSDCTNTKIENVSCEALDADRRDFIVSILRTSNCRGLTASKIQKSGSSAGVPLTVRSESCSAIHACLS